MHMQDMAACVQALAGPDAVPGGGGAAALCGALAAALGSMAANLTVNKKTGEAQQQLISAIERLGGLCTDLYAGIEADAQAFLPLSKAYGLPRKTDEEKAERARIMESALNKAVQPPLEILELCVQTADILDALADTVGKLVVSDVGCAAALCRGALKSAALNVYINTNAMKDRAAAQALENRARACVEQGCAKCESVYQKVEAIVCPS